MLSIKHSDETALRTVMQQVLADAQAQDVLVEWWPMMERALGHNAINEGLDGAGDTYKFGSEE